jgi:type IV fimbrial biogenesis protein FimT
MAARCITSGRQRRAGRGFTLIEIMIALIIFATLLSAALPAYRDWIAAQQLANHAHFIADTLDLARSEAIKHGYRVNVCKTRDQRVCTDEWRMGAGLVALRRRKSLGTS